MILKDAMQQTHPKRLFAALFLMLNAIVCIALLFMLKPLFPSGEESVEEIVVIYQPAPTPGDDLRMMEGNAEITIPPSAKEIHGMTSGFRELSTWVRFDLPEEDLPLFLESSRCTTPLSTTHPQEHSPGKLDPEWWQPNKATDLEECTGLHEHIFQDILVDRSASEKVTIYVFASVQDYSSKETMTPTY